MGGQQGAKCAKGTNEEGQRMQMMEDKGGRSMKKVQTMGAKWCKACKKWKQWG